MKPYIFLLLISGFMLGCSSPVEKKKLPEPDKVKPDTKPVVNNSDTSWHAEFLALKKVLAKPDKNGLKKFMSFPIMNAGNYIWRLVDTNGSMDIPADEIKPFTEADYEKYYPILFTYNLPPAIRRINAKELFKEHFFRTLELTDETGVKTLLEVKYDTYASRLTFRLITTSSEWQFTRFYHFNVEKGKISFHQLVLG